VETVIVAFTDHLAVGLHITLDAPLLRRGRRRWKMNEKATGGTLLGPTTAQMVYMGTREKEIFKQRYVVVKLCQNENPIHI